MKLEETKNRHLKWKNVDYSKTKKEIIIRRHCIGEELSDNTLAKFQPNWFRRCRLGVKNVRSTCRNFHVEERIKMYFLRLLTSNGIITPLKVSVDAYQKGIILL